MQATGARTLYCEHFLYPPIYDIAKGREWAVQAQQPLKGSAKTIDFIFFRPRRGKREAGLVFLEVKYLTGINPSQECKRLGEDFQKLKEVSAERLKDADEASKCGPGSKFVLVVGQHNDLQAIAKKSPRKYQNVVALLRASLKDKSPKTVYRSIVETKLKSELHWNVIAIGERAWQRGIVSK